MAIREKLAPDSLEVSDSLNNLGVVAHLRGELATAEAYYTRALAIKEKLAPDSLTVADGPEQPGDCGQRSWRSGGGGGATTSARLAIDEKLAPDSLTWPAR